MPTLSERTELLKPAASVRLLAMDVDGVMTDGRLWYSAQGETMKVFDVRDGQGLSELKAAGVVLAILSGRGSDALKRRAADLGIAHLYLNLSDKVPAFEQLLQEHGMSAEDVCFVGDDLPDIPVLARVGLPLTVPGAPVAVRQAALAATEAKAGRGAIREVCELLLTARRRS